MDELRTRKIHMISALWANSNIEGDDRSKAINELEENFEQSVLYIYGQKDPNEEEIDWENDPFFAAAKRGMDEFGKPELEEEPQEAPVAEVVEVEEMMKDSDQH